MPRCGRGKKKQLVVLVGARTLVELIGRITGGNVGKSTVRGRSLRNVRKEWCACIEGANGGYRR